jgi:hypothetical protein
MQIKNAFLGSCPDESGGGLEVKYCGCCVCDSGSSPGCSGCELVLVVVRRLTVVAAQKRLIQRFD